MLNFLTDPYGDSPAEKEWNLADQAYSREMQLVFRHLQMVDAAKTVSSSSLGQAQRVSSAGEGPDLYWWDVRNVGVFYLYDGQDLAVVLVGKIGNPPAWSDLLRVAQRRVFDPLSRNELSFPPIEVEQGPGAYRFRLHEDKLDVLPEPPEAEDEQFAVDIYEDLITKARELLDRLKRTNSAARVCNDVERLLSALGTNFDELRPGLLLSRARSIEADRAAFDTEEARVELFADAFAMMDDTLQTLRDLLAVFPIVRRIEAERLALDLDRNREAVPVISEHIDEIQQGAEELKAATEQAIRALGANDPAIEEATDPVLRTSLIADKLLVVRNFLSAAATIVGKELGGVAGPSWAAFKVELPKGIGAATRVAPFMALIAFVGWAAGPVLGIASVVPALKPIAAAFTKLVGGEKLTRTNTKPTPKKPASRARKPKSST
jgi:hypothetical protein